MLQSLRLHARQLAWTYHEHPRTQRLYIQQMKKKYEVVCEMGRNNHMLRIVEAESEMQARKIMWEKYMDDSQKNNCADIEVFEVQWYNSLNKKLFGSTTISHYRCRERKTFSLYTSMELVTLLKV